MQTTGFGRRGFWRGAALLVVLALLEFGIVRAVGPVGAQVRVLGGLGDPSADAVAGLLTVLAVLAEVLALYLLLVLALRLAAWLPGVSGRLAMRSARLVTMPVLRRALDGLLGGVLLAQLVVAPVAAKAEPVPPSDRPPAAAAAAIAGGSRVSAAPGPGGPEAQPGVAGRTSQAPGTTGAGPAASTAPPPTWVPLPTWLGGSQVPATSAPGSATAGPAPGQASPRPSAGHGPDAGAAAGGAGAADADVAVSYVIRPGDSLWDVAEAQLPPGQRSPSRTDRYWRQIHAANRDALGADPDLIHPGARIVLPPFGLERGGGR
jgi:resuscitation-promoting factor RpfA